MRLEGSCHCKKVVFSLVSQTPCPFMQCYCSICRKTAGSGGFAINLGGEAKSLQVTGKEHIRVYHARMDDGDGNVTTSQAERHFCGHCGSALWLWTKQSPELIHPHASAIDTPLPIPPKRVHMMLKYAANWVDRAHSDDQNFEEYPAESLQQWHQRHHLMQ